MIKRHYWGYKVIARVDDKLLLAYNFIAETYAMLFFNNKKEIYKEKYYEDKRKAIKEFKKEAKIIGSKIQKVEDVFKEFIRISLSKKPKNGDDSIMLGSVFMGYEIFQRADFKVAIGFNRDTEYYAVFNIDADNKLYYGRYYKNQNTAMLEFHRRAKQQNARDIVLWRD